MTVDAASARSTTAIVRVYRREGRCWHAVAGPWPAHLGRNGLSRHHREGDGTTPLGTFRIGSFAYGVWTDWRDTRQGTDPRELPEDEDNATADVYQCRVLLSSTDKKGNVVKSWSGDRCPHSGGIDQNIYGDLSP